MHVEKTDIDDAGAALCAGGAAVGAAAEDDAATDAEAAAVDASCAQAVPRPPAFQPLQLDAGAPK